jgi:hypothetical protein
MAQKTAAQLGTDQIDPVVGFVARTITRSAQIDADGDKKIEGLEILDYAQKTGFDGFATFRGFSIKEFRAQLADLDATERDKQIDLFAKDFKLSNTEAEMLVEDWVRYLDQGAFLIERTRRLVKKA